MVSGQRETRAPLGPASGRGRRVGARIARAGAALMALTLAVAAEAAETFNGIRLQAAAGQYRALKDAIVRAKPDGKSERAGSVKQGDLVDAFGKADGGWIAVAKEERRLGFVHGSLLLPLIDGTLTADLIGKVKLPGGGACDYVVHFEGKSEVDGEEFTTSDYDVSFRCERKNKKMAFNAPMFITEVPYQGSGAKAVYQINLDVLGITDDPDRAFSTILFYDRDAGQIALDTVSPADLKGSPDTTDLPATGVPQALKAAVELAVMAWGPKAWDAVAKLRH